MLDQGLSALVQDLHDRGLDKDVSVIVEHDSIVEDGVCRGVHYLDESAGPQHADALRAYPSPGAVEALP